MFFERIALSSILFRVTHATTCLNVNTTSGAVEGFVNAAHSNVAQFLGIPFAEPPTGARRWLPPLPKAREHGTINATSFGPSCPQYRADPALAPNAYNVDVLQFSPDPLEYQSEDCLSLSIWAPKESVASDALPVIIWLYGGGFGEGGTNAPYQNPAPWIERSQKHIVVSIK
jgi:acetylcholinesterase